MEKINLVIYPDKRLKTESNLVEKFDDDLRAKLNNMELATQFFKGIGIAGVQIGYMDKIIYINHDAIVEYENQRLSTKNELLGKPLFIINPLILQTSEETFSSDEGCLSLPFIQANVTRYKNVKIQYHDEFGILQIIETSVPLLSACIQHEIDHVNGITIAEHQSKLKKDQIIKKIQKFLEQKEFVTSFEPDQMCETGCAHEHH